MSSEPPRTLCIGGAAIDRTYRSLSTIRLGTSNPVIGSGGFGGVARNVAETMARLGCATALASVVGDDNSGWAIVNHLAAVGVDVELVDVANARPTAEYLAVLNQDGSLCIGIANMSIFDEWTVADLARIDPQLGPDLWVFADANLPADVLAAILDRRRQKGFRLAFDAVSILKAARLPFDLSGLDLLVLNKDEAEAILGQPDSSTGMLARGLLGRGAAAVVISRGSEGAVVASGDRIVDLPAIPAEVIDVTGGGDGLVGGTIAGLANGLDLVAAVQNGIAVAALTVEFPGSVRPDLTPELVVEALERLG